MQQPVAIPTTSPRPSKRRAPPLRPPTMTKLCRSPSARRGRPEGPTIIDTSGEMAAKKAPKMVPVPLVSQRAFRLPSTDMLEPPPATVLEFDERALAQKRRAAREDARRLRRAAARSRRSFPAPTVTTFEVSPAAGTKVTKVAALADDLALALARKVRIVAPIPGKNRIGFELPNEKRVPVNLRDLVEDRRFQTLNVAAAGRARSRHRRQPRLRRPREHAARDRRRRDGRRQERRAQRHAHVAPLPAHARRAAPADDRSRRSSSSRRSIASRTCCLPVVTDMKQAANALKWAVDEMERRYQLFADAGTKNIGTYNGWVEARAARRDATQPARQGHRRSAPTASRTSVASATDGTRGRSSPSRSRIIVIVVDEFADLMMQQGKEVEACVARLAQKARAAGMHVILATQRPSVDVITGMIKANFPTRIAFRVAQKIDSRTILDEQGAEHLLGRGDMLIKLNGTNETRRVQCPWVSEEEVQKVTDFLRAQGEPVYDENILKPRDDEEAGEDGRGSPRRPDVRRRGPHRRRDAPLLDLVAPAQARPRLQPRGAHRRDDGEARPGRPGERREGPRSPHRFDLNLANLR